MEIVASAASTLWSGATTVTNALGLTSAATGAPLSLTGAATGAAATSAGLFGSSSWLSLLQGGASALSVFSGLAAGEEKSQSLNAAARDADFQASQERIAGEQRQSSLRRAAADQMAERDAAYAASGVDLSFGTPQIAKAQDIEDASRALGIDQSNTEATVARRQEQAAEYRRASKSARRAATLKAVMSGLETGLSLNRRGVLQGA